MATKPSGKRASGQAGKAAKTAAKQLAARCRASLYAESGCGFDRADEAVAVDLVAVASTVLSLGQAYAETLAKAEGVRDAMRSRAVIEQAKGMLMARFADMGPDEPFAVLVGIGNGRTQRFVTSLSGSRSVALLWGPNRAGPRRPDHHPS